MYSRVFDLTLPVNTTTHSPDLCSAPTYLPENVMSRQCVRYCVFDLTGLIITVIGGFLTNFFREKMEQKQLQTKAGQI